MPTTDIEWISLGYLLALAAVIPAAGWLGDRFGTKRIFVIALVIFVVTSLLCGLSQTLGQLIGFRVLQGIGGGLLTPVGGAMLYRAYSMEDRAKAAIGVLSVTVIAPAVGPVLGGLIVDQASWHWIFYINVPIGALALVLSTIWLRETIQPDPGGFDAAGFVLSSAAVALLLYTLSIGPEEGWSSPTTLAFGAAGVISLIAMIVVELRVDHPIIALRLLRDHLFRTINIASAMIYAGFFGLVFVLPLYMQSLRGFSALESGLAQAPQAVGVFLVANLLGRRLYRIVGPRRLMVVGHGGDLGDHVLLRARRSRHAAVADRDALVPPRSRRRHGLRVDPDRRVRHDVDRRHRSGDVAVQHPAPDRVRIRRRTGGNGDRVEADLGRRRLGAGLRTARRLPGRVPRGRPDHGARGVRVVVHRRRRRRRDPRAGAEGSRDRATRAGLIDRAGYEPVTWTRNSAVSAGTGGSSKERTYSRRSAPEPADAPSNTNTSTPPAPTRLVSGAS